MDVSVHALDAYMKQSDLISFPSYSCITLCYLSPLILDREIFVLFVLDCQLHCKFCQHLYFGDSSSSN